MNKLDVIKFLINEIEVERDKGPIYLEETRRAQVQAEKENRSYWSCFNYDIRDINKSKIKNDLKMIRRLTLEIEKEL